MTGARGSFIIRHRERQSQAVAGTCSISDRRFIIRHRQRQSLEVAGTLSDSDRHMRLINYYAQAETVTDSSRYRQYQ